MLDRRDLGELETLLAGAAREALLPHFRRVRARTKADGSVITDADLGMQARVAEALHARWPGIGLLGEEMTADAQEALIARGGALWVLDPLDGTANFASGLPFFGVSLALLAEGEVQAGVVLDPVRGEVFSALRGRGAWLDGRPLRRAEAPASLAQAMAMVDLKRLPAPLIERLARAAPYRSQRSFGSVALDWCWLAAGRVQLYLHGGQRLWDHAAGSLVFAETGGHGGLFEDYAGRPVDRPVLAPRIAVAAGSAPLFAAWTEWIGGALRGND